LAEIGTNSGYGFPLFAKRISTLAEEWIIGSAQLVHTRERGCVGDWGARISSTGFRASRVSFESGRLLSSFRRSIRAVVGLA